MNKRKVYLDQLRIFTTFALMLLHVSASNYNDCNVGGFQWQVFNIYDSITRFCVPVFLMISGGLFLDKDKSISMERLIKHNILRIITAFLFFSISYAIFVAMKELILDKKVLNHIFIKEFICSIVYGHYHLWFLFTIVGLYLITPLLRMISKDRKMIEYFILLSFIFCFTANLLKFIPILYDPITNILNRMSIHFIMGFTAYYLTGHYLHTYELNGNIKKLINIMAGISLLFTIIGTSILSITIGIADQRLYSNQLPTTFFVSCSIFLLFKDKVSQIKLNDMQRMRIQKLSSMTFGIYLVHDFFNMIFHKIGLSTLAFNPIISVPVIAIIIFVCSYMVVSVIQKIPVLNKYII